MTTAQNDNEPVTNIVDLLFYDDATKAIDFLVHAFGFRVASRTDDGDGRVATSKLVLGDNAVIVSDRVQRQVTWAIHASHGMEHGVPLPPFYVADVDAHCARARAAGAVIKAEPATHDHGGGYLVLRSYEAVDPEGRGWVFAQRL